MKKLKRLNVPEVTQLIAEVRFEPYDIEQATQVVDSAIGLLRSETMENLSVFTKCSTCHP